MAQKQFKATRYCTSNLKNYENMIAPITNNSSLRNSDLIECMESELTTYFHV